MTIDQQLLRDLAAIMTALAVPDEDERLALAEEEAQRLLTHINLALAERSPVFKPGEAAVTGRC